MLEEAIIILKDGLKINPAFSAARVSLGKVYLQKGRVAEAKTEFEKVLAQNPDNLMAQKKLALIYRDEGNTEKARLLCEAILLTNPKDVEMKKLVLGLEGLRTQSIPRDAAAEKEDGPQLSPEPSRSPGQSLTLAPVDRAGQESPDRRQGTESHEIPRDMQKGPENQSTQQYSGPPIEPQAPVASCQVHQTAIPATPKEPEAAVSEEALATVGIAELYIKQGHYEHGIDIYRKILEQDPDNAEVRQRLEDALALANLLTKRSTEPKSQRKTVITPEPPAKPVEAPPPDGPARSSPEQLRRAKVQRLQAWLEQLKRSQNQ